VRVNIVKFAKEDLCSEIKLKGKLNDRALRQQCGLFLDGSYSVFRRCLFVCLLQLACGIVENPVRLSVGLSDCDELRKLAYRHTQAFMHAHTETYVHTYVTYFTPHKMLQVLYSGLCV
jgi:hypothetical protein